MSRILRGPADPLELAALVHRQRSHEHTRPCRTNTHPHTRRAGTRRPRTATSTTRSTMHVKPPAGLASAGPMVTPNCARGVLGRGIVVRFARKGLGTSRYGKCTGERGRDRRARAEALVAGWLWVGPVSSRVDSAAVVGHSVAFVLGVCGRFQRWSLVSVTGVLVWLGMLLSRRLRPVGLGRGGCLTAIGGGGGSGLSRVGAVLVVLPVWFPPVLLVGLLLP